MKILSSLIEKAQIPMSLFQKITYPFYLLKDIFFNTLLSISFFICILIALGRGLFYWGNPEVGHWGARLIFEIMKPLLGIKVKVEYDIEALNVLWGGNKDKGRLYLENSPISSDTSNKPSSSSSPTLKKSDNLPYQSCIIMPNHQHAIDVIVGAAVTPDICVSVAKSELRMVPLFGLLWSLAGNLWINRDNRKKGILDLKKAAIASKDFKRHVLIFPEGTRNRKMNCILPYKKGPFYLAVESQSPIVVMVFSPYSWIRSNITGWLNGGLIIVKYCKPIPTKGLTYKDIPKLQLQVRTLMVQEYMKLDSRMMELSKEPSRIATKCE